MEHKVALISGGTSGICKAAARQLLSEGWYVAAFGLSSDKAEAVRGEFSEEFPEDTYLILHADVTEDTAIRRVVAETIARFGKIDMLFNNAGFGFFTPADEVDIEQYEEMIDVNVTGIARLTQAVLPHMKKQGSGLILNMASISGKRAWAKGAFYSATKFAVMGYSEGLRADVAPFGIKVSTLCPGMIDTPFFTPEELERRRREGGGDVPMLDLTDITRLISLVANQSQCSDIQDITIMPF